MEQTERDKIRKQNCSEDLIYRKATDYLYVIQKPVRTVRGLYPWESESKLPRITKDFFRCKGSHLHTSLVVNDQTISDCDGSNSHGLPIINGKEGIYPVLIDLLNYVQKKTGKRVIITCGHRCPTHNQYADASQENQVSKHQIGAEVDFYVQSMEERPTEIVALVMQYFQETPFYKTDKENLEFKRFEKSDLVNKPWFNKEIFIKLLQKNEGRDGGQ